MSSKPVIEKGADFTLDFNLTKNGVIEPLGAPSEITVLIPAAASGTNSIAFTKTGGKVTIVSDACGQFKVTGTEVDSTLLKASQQSDIVIKIKRGTEDILKNLKNALIIEDQAVLD